MRVYTITVAIEDDPFSPDGASRDWDQVARAARLVASHVTSDGLPGIGPGEGRVTLLSGARCQVFLSGIDLAIPPPVAPESAWVVVPQSPSSKPVNSKTPSLSGYNMLPCRLEVAQDAAGKARDSELLTVLDSLSDAFRVAVENHNGPPAYIIDHGNGAYSVVV